MPFTSRDVNDVARLVALKLETYINDERRELSFDPSGRGRRTTTWQYDRVNCTAARARIRGWRQGVGSSSDAIRPFVIDDAFRSVSRKETSSIIIAANQIFRDHPIDKLQEALAYKPGFTRWRDVKTPQNYTEHVGSCLTSRDYREYYIKEGMGNKSNNLILKPKSQQQPPSARNQTSSVQNSKPVGDKKNAPVPANRRLKPIEQSKSEPIKSGNRRQEKRYKSNNQNLMRMLLDDEKNSETTQPADRDKKCQKTGTDSETTTKNSSKNTGTSTDGNPSNNGDRDQHLADPNNENLTEERRDSKIDSAFFESLYKV